MYMVQHSKEDLTWTSVYLSITSMRPPPEVSKQLVLFNKICDTKDCIFCVIASETVNPVSVCSLACMGHLVHTVWINTKGYSEKSPYCHG